MAAVAMRDHATGPAVAPVLFIRSRAAVAMWLMGLTLTKACSQPGMVRGWTKTLLANESGISTTLAMLVTTAGSRTSKATEAHSQDSESPKATALLHDFAVSLAGAPTGCRECTICWSVVVGCGRHA